MLVNIQCITNITSTPPPFVPLPFPPPLFLSTSTPPFPPPSISPLSNSASLAYDVVDYLVSETEHLHTATNIFTKYFPNILKVCALSQLNSNTITPRAWDFYGYSALWYVM